MSIDNLDDLNDYLNTNKDGISSNTLEDLKAVIYELGELRKEMKFYTEQNIDFGVPSTDLTNNIGVAYGCLVSENEQPTEFNVILSSLGPNKIKTLKIIREHMNITLQECTRLVNNPTAILMHEVSMEEAKYFKSELVKVGATVIIKDRLNREFFN